MALKESIREAARKRRAAAKARKDRVEFRKILSRYATPSEKQKFLDAAKSDRSEAEKARRIAAKRRDKVKDRKTN